MHWSNRTNHANVAWHPYTYTYKASATLDSITISQRFKSVDQVYPTAAMLFLICTRWNFIGLFGIQFQWRLKRQAIIQPDREKGSPSSQSCM